MSDPKLPMGTATQAAVAAPIVQALANIRAEREKAENAIKNYEGYENSQHYQPWVDRLRLLQRAEAGLEGVLSDAL